MVSTANGSYCIEVTCILGGNPTKILMGWIKIHFGQNWTIILGNNKKEACK